MPQLSAVKCGNCQAKSKAASSQPPGCESVDSGVASVVWKFPAAAAQPISGGMPPTIAPTHVFITEMRLRGVYTPAYSAMLSAPSAATVGFTPM